MPSEINGNQSGLSTGSTRNKGVGQAAKPSQSAPDSRDGGAQAAAPTDTVSISQTGQQLQSLENSVRQEPEVRESLVEAIKQKVNGGTYQIDSKAIARAIVEQENLL